MIMMMILFFLLYFFDFCVFFFKQKTAYEMRISDWSSDVCSSDLVDISDDGVEVILQSGAPLIDGWPLPIDFGYQNVFLRNTATQTTEWLTPPEIGRASCRERVCQYV